MYKLGITTLFLAYLLTFVHSNPLLNESCASKLNETCATQLLKEVNTVYWQSAATYRQFADDTLTPELLMREKLRPFYETMEKFDWQNFTDPLLKRQFEVLLKGEKYPPINYAYKKYTNILKSMSKRRYVCDRTQAATPRRKCNMAWIHQIKTVVANSDDLDEIKWYWTEWRNRMPADIKESLHYYIQYFQNMSTPERPASAIWYDQYEDRNFMTELEGLMETIRPFYREVHAHLRHVLRVQYGTDIIPASGLIPHHLMEQALHQSWKKQSVMQNPFPQRKLPNLQQELDDKGYFPFDMVNISAQYFTTMGFDNLTG